MLGKKPNFLKGQETKYFRSYSDELLVSLEENSRKKKSLTLRE